MPIPLRAATALAALLVLGGCGGGGGEPAPAVDLAPAPTGIEVVNESKEHVLLRWHSKSAGGGGSAVVAACSDRRIEIPSGSYRIIFSPTSLGDENVDWEVVDDVSCCAVISAGGVFSLTKKRPPPLQC
jgi:hypothetical protein